MLEKARRFLRCLIRVNPTENLGDNAFRILESPLDFSEVSEPHQQLYTFIKDFYREYEDYPTYQTLKEFFGDKMALEVTSEIEEIKPLVPQTGKDFKHTTDDCIREINRVCFNNLLKRAGEINNSGIVSKKGKEKEKLLGAKDAINEIFKSAERYFYTAIEEKTECEVGEATADALQRYETLKDNPLANYGVLSGFDPIDRAIKGVKKKDLLLIAGAVGECKTTLAMNWAYNACVLGGFNVLYISLEMSKENLQDILYCIHSGNSYLRDQAMRERGKDMILKFDDIREGLLDEDEDWYYRYVLEDWSKRGRGRDLKNKEAPEYGRFDIWEPNTELTPSLLQAKVDYFNKKTPGGIDLLIVDYPGLMVAENVFGGNETTGLNQIMKKLKRLALTFNGGEGIGIICPFQINREGKKEVVKKTENEKTPTDFGQLSKPVYSFYHLSYANEAERSADYILYTYLNHELRDQHQIHIGCIKNRHGQIFAPFLADTILSARHISYLESKSAISNDIPTGVITEESLF